MKLCKKCNLSKTLDLFNKDKSKKDGVCTFCKSCSSTYKKKWSTDNVDYLKIKNAEYHIENKQAQNTNSKKYYDSNKEQILKKNREKYKQDPSSSKNSDLKKRYNISLDDYNLMLQKQNNCCAICKTDKSLLSRALAVDHCHKTGKVRGLLCTNCNRMLGNSKDCISTLLEATKYLGEDNG